MGDWVAVTFDLSQGGKHFRRKDAGRIPLEDWPVALPCGLGAFRQGGTDRGEDLTGLSHNLIDPVEHEEPAERENAVPNNGSVPEEPPDPPGPLSEISTRAAIDRSRHLRSVTSSSNRRICDSRGPSPEERRHEQGVVCVRSIDLSLQRWFT